jgi:hypothetical protein
MHKKVFAAGDEERMGRRVRRRLSELGWRPIDLVNRIEGLDKQTLHALITRNSGTSKFSEAIAERLEVEHRWLIDGTGPKLRAAKKWPFEGFSIDDVVGLPPKAIGKIELFIEQQLEEHRQAGVKRRA